MSNFKVHPVLELFPQMPQDEFEQLKQDIQEHGQVEAIVVTGDDVLLDGRQRCRACEELGTEPMVVVRTASGISDAEFIWAKNFRRRHLTADQRAVLAMKFAEVAKAEARRRSIQNLKRGTEAPSAEWVNPPTRGRTRDQLAKLAETTPHKIQLIEMVQKDAPELLPLVESGEKSLAAVVNEINRNRPIQFKPLQQAVDLLVEDVHDLIEHFKMLVAPPDRAEFKRRVAEFMVKVADELRTGKRGALGQNSARNAKPIKVSVPTNGGKTFHAFTVPGVSGLAVTDQLEPGSFTVVHMNTGQPFGSHPTQKGGERLAKRLGSTGIDWTFQKLEDFRKFPKEVQQAAGKIFDRTVLLDAEAQGVATDFGFGAEA